MADDAQLPLLGVVMCCTSIPPEQRANLASVAEQMGAVHKFDLTSDVTHLIVGDNDTPKYKFVAKERSDVKVMLPSWIEAVRTSWLDGGSTDVEAAELKHQLPVYHGLRICVTGFDDLAYRKQLEDEIIRAGGYYSGNLTKDITHLIVKKPGSEKYEYARHREIKTVSIEWHEQSLERGMILDEVLYHPLLPASQRGRGAWIRRIISTTSLGKRARENDGGSQNARKLRRTTSAKFETHNDSLWTDIVGAEVKVENERAGDWDDNAAIIAGGEWPTKETGPVDAEVKTKRAEDERQALKRSQSLGSLESLLGKAPQREALFQASTFLLQGFDEKRASVLVRHLLSHGASLISTPSELPPSNAYLLVPHTTRKFDAFKSFESEHRPILVTDLWIERCLHRKQLLNPHENVTSTPFEHFQIPGFEKLNVSSTGFQGIDLLHASKAVNLMGGTYYEYFTEKSTVLVCNNVVPGHEKLRHAQLWGIAVVKTQWLWDCIREGKVLPFENYLVQPVGIADINSCSMTRPEKVATTCKNDSRPATRDRPLERSFRKPMSSKEQFKHHKRQPRDAKSIQGLGKSLLNNPFPDDAGPLLLPDEAEALPDLSSRKETQENLRRQSLEEKRTALLEISPNSSPSKSKTPLLPQPKPSVSPSKLPTPVPKDDAAAAADDDETLGPAISSLLSHHQAVRSSNTTTAAANPTIPSNPSQPLRGRRRRQLLGRAPSNLSSHSINLSRASSVDTLNTDGLGTPLEGTHSHSVGSNITITATKQKAEGMQGKAIYDHDHDHDPDRPSDEHLQMTQLGYEDPNVAAWRERVAVKMAGGKPSEATMTAAGKNAVDKQKEKEGTAGLGIAKRTRLASAGR